jgi:hypothetical protein
MNNLIEKSEFHRDYLVIPTYDRQSEKYSFVLLDRDLNPIETDFNDNFSSVDNEIAVGISFADYWQAGRILD